MLVSQFFPVAITVAALTQMATPIAAHAQAELATDGIISEAEWLEFKQAKYADEAILLHLKTGQARAVIWPEPIELLDSTQTLPGCAVEIDNDVVGFFPTSDFNRTSIRFLGLETQTIYELQIRASEKGIEEPLQITR